MEEIPSSKSSSFSKGKRISQGTKKGNMVFFGVTYRPFFSKKKGIRKIWAGPFLIIIMSNSVLWGGDLSWKERDRGGPIFNPTADYINSHKSQG